MQHKKDYAILHFVIFVWGITGVIGKAITLDALQLVWFRLLIASVVLMIFSYFKGDLARITKRQIGFAMLAGGIIGLHWIAFFLSIKLGTVSIALAMLSSAALFTSLFEPIFFKRKIKLQDCLLGMVVVIGIIIIFGFELQYKLAIIIGIIAAALTALFATLNGVFMQKKYNLYALTSYEMLGAFLLTTVILFVLPLTSSYTLPSFDIGWQNWTLLLVLGVLCTDVTVVGFNYVLQRINPFTANLNLNLEPVYGILLALLFFGEDELMSLEFYLGVILILSTLFVHHVYNDPKRGTT